MSRTKSTPHLGRDWYVIKETLPVIKSKAVLDEGHPFEATDIYAMLRRKAIDRASHAVLHWSSPGLARTWTYATFLDDVDATAAGLQRRGVGVGTPVVIHLENCPAFLIVWFACARLGAVAVNVNARYSVDELKYAEEITNAVGFVTNSVDVVEAVGAAKWAILVAPDVGTAEELFDDVSSLVDRPADPQLALGVQFTSGSTSRPKAVLYSNANALWAAREGAAHFRLDHDDVQLVFAPLFHTLALFWQTLATVWIGGTVVLQAKFSVSQFWDVSVNFGCTRTTYMPLLRHTIGVQPIPTNSYRSWIGGAQEMELRELFGIDIFATWGMTEVVTQPIYSNSGDGVDEGAVGMVADGYEIRIVNERGEPTQVDEPGELLIRGVRGLSIFCEYLADDDATAAAFDHEGFFRTGDRVASLPSGAIRYVGRTKDMMRVGGENVAASEVERVIQSVPGVGEAAVVGRPDPVLGEVPVAFVIATDSRDFALLSAQVMATCETMLANFKVPRSIYELDDFPRAINKVSKIGLRELLEKIDNAGLASSKIEGTPPRISL